MAGTATPTSGGTASSGPSGSIGAGSAAAYDAWATSGVFSGETVQASTVEMQALQSPSMGPTPTPTPGGTQGPIDPILGLPLVFSLTAAFSGFALAGFGLSQMASEGGPTERIHVVGDAVVFEGSYDVESVTSTATGSQASESGSYGGHTLLSSGQGSAMLAASENTLITTGSEASDPQAVVEAAIDAAAGSATAYSAEHDAYADLASVLDAHPITGLAFSPEGPINAGTPTPTPTPSMGGGSSDFLNMSDFNPEGAIHGYASGLSSVEGEATAQIAFRYASSSEVGDTDALASGVAPSSNDVSVASSGSLVLVTAGYADVSTL